MRVGRGVGRHILLPQRIRIQVEIPVGLPLFLKKMANEFTISPYFPPNFKTFFCRGGGPFVIREYSRYTMARVKLGSPSLGVTLTLARLIWARLTYVSLG